MLSQVYKAKRALLARLYPTTLTFKDGSTITIKHFEPRQIIKMPLTESECDEKSKTAWQIRRRAAVVESTDKVLDDVRFDAKKYLRPRKR